MLRLLVFRQGSQEGWIGLGLQKKESGLFVSFICWLFLMFIIEIQLKVERSGVGGSSVVAPRLAVVEGGNEMAL